MNDNDTTAADELASLKQRADLMGIQYHPSIGLEKLREKVNAAVTKPAQAGQQTAEAIEKGESETAYRQRCIADATRLIRIRLTNMNPLKKEWDGEVITVGNTIVGTLKKYIPFNAEEGWHVPYMMYEELRDRQCQVFFTKTDHRGYKVREGKLIKEFAIEVLPQLTTEELKDLAQRQAMAKAID